MNLKCGVLFYRGDPMKKVQSTCNYCSLACEFDFYTEDNQITRVLPTKHYPVNKGFSCIKGLNLDKQNQMFNPIKTPRLKTTTGEFTYASWDEGISYTANKLTEIIEKYGPGAVAGLSTGQLTLEEMALIGHVMRTHLKANLDGNTRLCMATSVVAHKQSFGFDAPPYTLNDFELSDTIILIGANPVVAHPIIWGRIRQNKLPNKKVIVIDPRRSETAQNADYYYGLKAKSDLVLMYTIANVLIEKDYVKHDYIANYTENFDAFKSFVAEYTLENVEARTGLTAEQVLELVEHIHNGQNVSLWWTMGVNQGYEAVRTAQSIINIALMTGNIGRPGTGANSITGQSNAMGSRVYSNQAGLYGGGDYDNQVRREAVGKALKMDPALLPAGPTLPYNVIIEKINAGEIKALWVMATNPRHSWTNNETFKAAMEKLELLIVQDIYDDTDTALHADVFFPTASALKKEGTLINTERRLSPVRPVLEKEENELTDFEIFYKMGEALGIGELIKPWQTPREVFELMKACSKGMPCDITGVKFDDLTDSKGIQWPFKEGDVLVDDERRLFEDNQFYTPNKKAKFMFEAPMENPVPLSDEFPIMFNTGRGTVGQWHTQTRTREISYVIDAVSKEAIVYIHPNLATQLGVKNKDLVEVSSVNGQSATFKALISEGVHELEVWAPIHYIETNKLTPSIYDSYSKEPSYKSTPVRITAVKED